MLALLCLILSPRFWPSSCVLPMWEAGAPPWYEISVDVWVKGRKRARKKMMGVGIFALDWVCGGSGVEVLTAPRRITSPIGLTTANQG